jgi:hypothetical protein
MKRLLRLLDDAWIGLPAMLLFALLLTGPAHMIVQI